jgi:fatty-acid desaturase
MSYLELKHTADSVSYIDSLERNHKKNQSTENTVELELTHQALFQVTTNILYLISIYLFLLVFLEGGEVITHILTYFSNISGIAMNFHRFLNLNKLATIQYI